MPMSRVATTKPSRTQTTSTSRYAARPPHTPAKTRSSKERWRAPGRFVVSTPGILRDAFPAVEPIEDALAGAPKNRGAAPTGSARTSGAGSRSGAGPSASFQAVSAGRISVAILPAPLRAWRTASAASPASERESGEVWTQCETGRAMPSTSLASGVS